MHDLTLHDPRRRLVTSSVLPTPCLFAVFFFNDTATTEIYTLSLHDALPILTLLTPLPTLPTSRKTRGTFRLASWSVRDRKSTRLNSSHITISYAVFCLKKKKSKGHRREDALNRHPIETTKDIDSEREATSRE